MNLKPSNTAILIFTRTATSEAKHKRFQNHIGFKQNVAIADAFIQHTILQAQNTNLPFFVVSDDCQYENCFGERLANALESTFQKGFQKVIIIGNDCPKLCSKKIELVQEQLLEKNLVIGPAKDGGTYVIGIDKSIYNREKFIQLPWLTNQLANAFDSFTNGILYLEEAEDVDNFFSFSTFLIIPSKDLKNLIFNIKNILGQLSWSKNLFVKTDYQSINLSFTSLRAPPF